MRGRRTAGTDAGDLPRPRRLHHSILLRGEAGAREGSSDVELRRDPCLWDAGGVRRSCPPAAGRDPTYNRQETPRAQPWAVSDAPDDFVAGMLRGIVGIALPIARLEGKMKMSQNRPAADIPGVVEGLRQDGMDDLAAAVVRATSAKLR